MNTKLNNINIIIADGQEIYTGGLLCSFDLRPAWNVVATTNNGQDLVDLVTKHKPDLVITDISMAAMCDGLDATKRIHAMYPSIGIVAFTHYDDEYNLQRMIAAGAGGYLLKSIERAELYIAIEVVLRGEQYRDQILVERAQRRKWGLSAGQRVTNEAYSLPDLEITLIGLMCQRLSVIQIAKCLEIPWCTCRRYCKSILKATGCQTRGQLIAYAYRHRIYGNDE